MINIFSKYKIFFYSANLILIFLYLFPGSFIGCFLYDDCKIQPQIIRDLSFISTNHVFAFILLSLIAWMTYIQYSKINFVFYYLFFLSIVLEILHILIPVRSFEWSDLIGNILGVFIIFITYELFKKKNIRDNTFFIILLIILNGCSSIPQNTSNSCEIFDERYLWYKHSKKVEQKWGTPIHIQLAIIKMESDFDWLAKPPRQKLFKVIPFKRPSSSFGYSQAVEGTWEQYKNETDNKFATRARFKDSVDFIGWYTNKTKSILNIPLNDAFKQYVAYHEGWGNYKHYKKNKKVIGLAEKVEKQSKIYKNQLSECRSSLNKNKYIIF